MRPTNRPAGASGAIAADAQAALWPSPWPAEDGGPARRQAFLGRGGLRISSGDRLELAARRDAFASTMIVLREPGEVFALRHALGRRPLRDPSQAWVERVDARTLEPLAASPRLEGGPFWPGGLSVHSDGTLHVVHGRFCHRLSLALEVMASRELPQPRPYNSFVVLADGTLAMKEIDRDLRAPAHLTLLDPVTLEPRCPEVVLPEPAIARLSADGGDVYVVGITTVWRYRWDGHSLEKGREWRVHYHGGSRHSYGWDPVIAGGQLWFLDNGSHDYATTMRGAGLAPGPVRLIRASLADCADTEIVEVSGAARGTVTNPPLYDPARQIAVAYDSGNGVIQAFRFRGGLTPLWRTELSHAAHMVLFPDTGELVVHDYRGPRLARTGWARKIGQRTSGLAGSAAVRHAMARSSADEVVVLDVETGAERARCAVPSMFQSVLFPAPGFDRDLYWCTFSTLARLEVVAG
ncbi:MAG: hypothetical protein ACJ764_08065 [Solirubrobacteraceae bacterium]